VGIIYDPMLDELFCARRGAGAWLNGVSMKTAATSELAKATIEVGWNMRAGSAAFLALLGRIVATGAGAIRAGSGALGLAYVAAGRRDGATDKRRPESAAGFGRAGFARPAAACERRFVRVRRLVFVIVRVPAAASGRLRGGRKHHWSGEQDRSLFLAGLPRPGQL